MPLQRIASVYSEAGPSSMLHDLDRFAVISSLIRPIQLSMNGIGLFGDALHLSNSLKIAQRGSILQGKLGCLA